MNSIWIARDDDGMLMVYQHKPVLDEGEWWPIVKGSGFDGLPENWYPEIKHGECREFRAVEGEA